MKKKVALTIAVCGLFASSAAPAPAPYSVLIRGGTIYDGSGRAPYVGDVAFKGDRIVYVGRHAPGRAARTVDADGKAVSPSLQKRVMQFRSQHGSDLLPEVGLLCFLASDSDDGDAQRDATRQALASRRRDQLQQVKGVIALLGEVEM